MKKSLAVILVSAITVLIVSGCTQPQAANNGISETSGMTGAANKPNAVGTEHVIEFTADGYAPNKLAIKNGDTVTWVNKTSTATWPASAKHPTHEAYPGSSIGKCGTAEEAKIFDACRGIKQNQSYSFTFNETGTWFYHDHLNPTKFGQIVVE